MKKQNGSAWFVLLVFVAISFGLGGWVWNVVKIVGSGFVLDGMLIARVIGVFVAPLGAVLGYC